MCSPSEATHNVTGIAFHSNEGRIERCAAYCVKHNIESFTRCDFRHIFFNERRTIIDRDGPEGLRDILLIWRDCREDFRAVSARKLNRNVAHAARASVNKYCVIAADVGAIYQGLPGCDGN